MEPQHTTTQQDSNVFVTITVTRGPEISGHPGHYWGRVDKTPRLDPGATVQFQWEMGMNLTLRDGPHPHGVNAYYPFGNIKQLLPIRDPSSQAALHNAQVDLNTEQILGGDRTGQYLVYLSPQNAPAAVLPDDWAGLKAAWDVDHPPAQAGSVAAFGDEEDPPEVIIMGSGGPGGRIDVKIAIITPEPPVQVFTQDADGRVTINLKGEIVIVMPLVEEPIPAEENDYLWFIDEDTTVVFTGSQGTIQPQLSVGSHALTLRHSLSPLSETVKVVVEAREQALSLLQRIINFFRRLFGGK